MVKAVEDLTVTFVEAVGQCPDWLAELRRCFDARGFRIGAEIHHSIIVWDPCDRLHPEARVRLHLKTVADVAFLAGAEAGLSAPHYALPAPHYPLTAEPWPLKLLRLAVAFVFAICGAQFDRFCVPNARKLDEACEGEGQGQSAVSSQEAADGS